MSGDELLTRMRQEASKRLDLALFRSGLSRRPSPPTPKPSSKPVFFFTEDEIPSRVALLRRHVPRVDAIAREADEICRHHFNLLGYDGLDYGSEIDWHLDAVHQKRAPLKPWFRVRFLDFEEVGDHKVTWELNRHQHLVTLAKAWCLTSEKKYVDELVKQWYDWQKANPYPIGINWASALEVAFRSLSWIWIRNLLAGCRELPPSFHSDLLTGLRQNGKYIARYHSKYFSPNTHLLGEAVALLYIGILCPEIPEARSWREWAWDIAVSESARQVRPDGVYFEQSLYYHVYAVDLFLYARALAVRNGFVIPEKLDHTLKRMLDFLFAECEAGAAEGFGDDDGGRVFNPRRNRVEHMTDPLAIGAAEYQRTDWGTTAGLTEEAVWLFGEEAVPVCTGERRPMPVSSRVFESGGVYFIRDSVPFSQQMMIDAGPQGADTCGHGHADALSLRYSLDGRRCLIDPGAYRYISAGDERSRFRGTAAHNTMRVEGVDQAIPRGPFAWDAIPQTRTRQWIGGETFNLFEGEHDGYRRLADPVLHRRMIFHVNGAFWLVRDMVEGTSVHTLETFWHFGPEFQLTEHEGNLTASLAASDTNGNRRDSRLTLLTASPSVWQMEVEAGETSPVYGVKCEAPVARVHAKVQLPAECAALLVPLAGENQAGQFEEIAQERGPRDVRVYRYLEGRRTHLIFCSDSNDTWTFSQWSSDARLFYCQIEEGRLTQMVLVAGSFAKWQDHILVSHPQRLDRFEWVYSNGVLRTSSSSSVAPEHAIDDSFAIFDPVC